MRKAIALIALVVAAVPVTGCGDDDDDERISKQEYITRSNALCEQTSAKAEAAFERMVGQDHPAPGEEQAFLAKTQRFYVEAAVPAIRQNVVSRRALPAPAGDEREVEAIIAAGEEALDQFDRIAEDRAQLKALFTGELRDPATRFDALSRRYGIDKCGGDQ